MYVLLVLLWILLNGKFTVEILVFGMIISLGIYVFVIKHMDYKPKREIAVIRNLPFFLLFFFLVIKEVFVANFLVIKKILFLKKDEPSSIVSFDLDLKTEFAQVVVANTITITPGTITIKIKDNHYIVHGLSDKFTEGIEESKIIERIKKMEEKLDV